MTDSTHAGGGAGTSQRFRSLDDPETLRELTRYLREGLYITDADGRLLDANPAFIEIIGAASIDEIVGRSFEEFLADPAPRRQALAERDSTVRELELSVVRADGERREILDTVYQRVDEKGQLFRHGIVKDATQYRALEARLRESVTRDSLTGAYNRRHLDVIAREVDRGGGGGWGCLYIDIEGFGAYNARHGRDAGDDVLIRMARFLMRHVRADEPVIRLSNDEFVVVLRGASDQRTERVARRLQLTALRTAPIAFTLGWAVREDGEGIDALLTRAADHQVPVRVVERVQDARGKLVEEPALV
jgi:diguanylate cyclase (GGDEF)-like protein/PAS domain S-box-containing protein